MSAEVELSPGTGSGVLALVGVWPSRRRWTFRVRCSEDLELGEATWIGSTREHVCSTDVRGSSVALILIICRLCKPSSDLYIAEHFDRDTALKQLLGVPAAKVDYTRLYRALDLHGVAVQDQRIQGNGKSTVPFFYPFFRSVGKS